MDAKKAAKFRKPFDFSKTNAAKALKIVSFGLVAYTAVWVYFYAQHRRKNPINYRDNVIDKYFESDEYLLKLERFKGRVPYPRSEMMDFWNKYKKDSVDGSRSGNV